MNEEKSLQKATAGSALGSVIAMYACIKNPALLESVMAVLFTSALMASIAKSIVNQKRTKEY